MDFFILDRKGNPLMLRGGFVNAIIEFSKFWEKRNRRIKLQKIGDIEISTVWMPVYSGYFTETMIFGGEFDLQAFRGNTMREAIRNHRTACKLVRLSQT
jgi:hypothetical protein